MTTIPRTLSYQSPDTNPRPSILHAFASGIILAMILHIFALLIGALFATIVHICGVDQDAVLFPIAALPLLIMFLISLYIFHRDRWLGFLIGAAISIGTIPILFFLPMLIRI